MKVAVFFGFVLVSGCAGFSLKHNTRIIGGEDTTAEDIPWHVTIQYYRTQQCGGAIINENTILTGAHCFETYDFETNPRAFTVRVGNSRRAVEGEIYETSRITKHPEFILQYYYKDIAIVKTELNIVFGPAAQPIALPDFQEPLPVGEPALITGFGYINMHGDFPEMLQKIYLPILDQQVCSDIYYKSSINPFLDENMFCAGTMDGIHDACKGDSGGPLVAKNKIFGIVSWGIQCVIPEYPGVFTSVSALRDWVDANM